MKANLAAALLSALWAASIEAAPTVDTTYRYTGPDIPTGDWVRRYLKRGIQN